MSVSDLSASTQDYLKSIWAMSEWSNTPVTAKLIADHLGLKISSVSDAVRRLTAQGLLDHAPYGAVELTETGRRFAVAMVRRHRLLETFLVQVLGYTWDEVHDEAENLEHAVSDSMIERIDAFLGHPSRDPHGDPIPNADGTVPVFDAISLTEVDTNATVAVERISDNDPELLQYLGDRGIDRGTKLHISQGDPFSGALDVSVEGTEVRLSLGRTATNAIYVSVLES